MRQEIRTCHGNAMQQAIILRNEGRCPEKFAAKHRAVANALIELALAAGAHNGFVCGAERREHPRKMFSLHGSPEQALSMAAERFISIVRAMPNRLV
jgi:hypothetical protein